MSYKYTWSAKDRFGQTVIKKVEAESARAAQDILLADGFSDLELKEDEIMTTVQAGFSKTVKVTAKQRVRQLENPSGTTWDILKPRLNEAIFFFLLFLLVSTFLFYRRDFLVAGFVTFVFIFLLGSHFLPSMQLIYYRELPQAADWHRWRKVLWLVAVLKNMGRMGATKIPALELNRYRAKAFAGLGNTEQALNEFAKCEGSPDCPRWMYRLLLAGLYGQVQEHDKAIEFSLAAISENPSPIAWYDLANRYARYKRDAVKAREALTEAERSPVPAHVKPYQARCRGIIAFWKAIILPRKRNSKRL